MTITNFLSGLLQNEYIITDLRGILDCNDPLQKLLEKIKKYKVDAKCKEIINKLIYINGLREDYECMKLIAGVWLSSVAKTSKNPKKSSILFFILEESPFF